MDEWWPFARSVLTYLWNAAVISAACIASNQANGTRWGRVAGAVFGGIILAPMIGLAGAGGNPGVFTVAVYVAILIGAASRKRAIA